jgi:hypothetical protein
VAIQILNWDKRRSYRIVGNFFGIGAVARIEIRIDDNVVEGKGAMGGRDWI